MGVSLIALVVLGLFLLFGLGAIVIGILATGTRSHRVEDGGDMPTSSPSWFTGLFAGGGEHEGQRPSHPDRVYEGSAPGSEGGAGDGGSGHDAGASGGFDGGGTDAGGGSDGGGSSGGGD